MKMKVPTLTRRDIARRVADLQEIKVHDADRWVDVVLGAIRDLLMTADPELRLEVRDFGVFEVKLTRAKPRARNPKTGDCVFVPPRRKSHFKPSKLLKSFLNERLAPAAEEALLRKLDLVNGSARPGVGTPARPSAAEPPPEQRRASPGQDPAYPGSPSTTGADVSPQRPLDR